MRRKAKNRKHIILFDNQYELLYMVRQRDDIANEMLIDFFYDKTYKMIYRYYDERSHMDKADYYQLSILKLFQAVDTFRDDRETSFSFYYEKVLRHTFTDIQRRAISSISYQVFDDRTLDAAIQESAGYYAYDHITDTNALFMQLDELKRRQEDLNDVEKMIVRMRLEGYRYQEIAEILHINKKKVDNTLYKVRYKKKIN